jgi:hypothetical protein
MKTGLKIGMLWTPRLDFGICKSWKFVSWRITRLSAVLLHAAFAVQITPPQLSRQFTLCNTASLCLIQSLQYLEVAGLPSLKPVHAAHQVQTFKSDEEEVIASGVRDQCKKTFQIFFVKDRKLISCHRICKEVTLHTSVFNLNKEWSR